MTISGIGHHVMLDGGDSAEVLAEQIAGNLTFDGLTLAHGNAKLGAGGEVYNAGNLTITNGTFSGNSAANGGSVYSDNGGLTVANGIMAGNLASGGAAKCAVTSTFQDGGYNLTNNSRDCNFSAFTDVQTDTPLLGSLAATGGPTPTIDLLASSPALDRIPNGANGCGTTITTDQCGVGRPRWGKCDIGTFVYFVKLFYDPAQPVKGATVRTTVQLTNTSGANVSASGITLAVIGIKDAATNTVSSLSGAFTFKRAGPDAPNYRYKFKTRGYAAGQYNLLFTAGVEPAVYAAPSPLVSVHRSALTLTYY